MTVRRVGQGLLVLWALGVILGEGLTQAANVLGLLFSVFLLASKRARVPADLRSLGLAALGLALWQALSPAVALFVTHASPRWPTSGRYLQSLDTLAAMNVSVLASVGVPWLALFWVLGLGWVLSTALGVYQHLVRWRFEQPFFLKTPVARVRESFPVDGPERFAAGGFLFHRLRFAHGAVATLGPTLAYAAKATRWRPRLLAGGVMGALLLAIYMSFARAALGAALLVIAVGLLLLSRGWARRAGMAVALLVVAFVAVSPSWNLRFQRARENLFDGERRLAMSVGMRLAKSHPIVGVGFGNHKPLAWATRAETHITELLSTDSHNLWLTTWAETGLLGLALLASYHVLLLVALLRRLRSGSWVVFGALLAFVGFHLLCIVHYVPYHAGVHLSFALALGLGLSVPYEPSSARR